MRQTVTLNNYKYIVELFKSQDNTHKIKQKYVMLRRFDIINSVMYDTDIYFIEKTLFDDLYLNGELTSGKIIYPIPGETKQFSKDYIDFNSDLSSDYISTDAYLLKKKVNGVLVDGDILCDTVKIYKPSNIDPIDTIIYFDNYINNIHFHYYCRLYSEHEPNSETEFREDNVIYSEFIEFYIPNIEDLFSKDTFFKEDLNSIYSDDPELKIDDDGDIYLSMYLMMQPFMIIKSDDNDSDKSYYSAYYKTIENNYLSYPVNVTLWPYIIDDESNIFSVNDKIQPNSDVFVSGVRFLLSSVLGFVDGKMNIISKFIYPNADKFSSFREAYEYYNNVSLDEYEGIEYDEEDDEYVEGGDNTVKQCGFEIIVSSTPNFTTNIYHNYIWADDIDDFSFDLSDIFSSWEQMPEILVCKTAFIDRYLGTTINSNIVIITKEWYKYLVNDLGIYRLNVNSMNDKFNFIDKVTCIIKQESPDQVSAINAITPTIVYKPIFFRTQDLQNIVIRRGLTQNIGINLAEYMTKVESFRITIDNIDFIESARNDIFVIFSIAANKLTNVSGVYHISNQDGEYISSGNWSVTD